MTRKYGTTQHRLNYATDYTEAINEDMKRIELLWQLGTQGIMSDDDVERVIKNHIVAIDEKIEEFKEYYKWRDDMVGDE